MDEIGRTCKACGVEKLLQNFPVQGAHAKKKSRGLICRECLRDDTQRVEKRVIGALQDTINQHGPITRAWVGSAAKRITRSVLTD